MQITDMLNQYNRNIASGVELPSGTQGIRQLMSSLQEMSVGNVFEGSVNQLENGIVTIGLSDGKTIQARLDSGVSVSVGQSMFFQVKANNGTQIAIRPFSNGNMENPTLLHALEAANLQVNSKTLTMVNAMMEQSMPIDKQSLIAMARLVMNHEGIDVRSVVQMTKLGIPVTEEMAAQFENYKSDQYAVLDQLESVMADLPKQLSGGNLSTGQLLEMNRQIAEVLLNLNPAAAEEEAGEPASATQTVQPETFAEDVVADLSQSAASAEEQVSNPLQADIQGGVIQTQAAEKQEPAEPPQTVLTPEENPESAQAAGAQKQASLPNPSGGTALAELFSGKELQQLAGQLSKIPEFLENPSLFSEGKLNGKVTSQELLQLMEQTFSSKNAFSKLGLAELVSSKTYRTLVRNVMEQQWLLRPQDLKTDHKVSELYERLDRQMEQMEKVLKSFNQNTAQLSDTTSGVRSNIQFMNQINQTYSYVQIPLKLAGQNAHSDLYVYTDKKKMQDPDAELTAFLHLDLEHLGSTDVSIRMKQRKVNTNFYLADDDSYQLILEHLDLLEERLEKKGYQAKIQISHQQEKVNFVEDFLNKGKPSAGGMVHRYSFDVRA